MERGKILTTFYPGTRLVSIKLVLEIFSCPPSYTPFQSDLTMRSDYKFLKGHKQINFLTKLPNQTKTEPGKIPSILFICDCGKLTQHGSAASQPETSPLLGPASMTGGRLAGLCDWMNSTISNLAALSTILLIICRLARHPMRKCAEGAPHAPHSQGNCWSGVEPVSRLKLFHLQVCACLATRKNSLCYPLSQLHAGSPGSLGPAEKESRYPKIQA